MFYKNINKIKKPNSFKVLVNKNNKLSKNYTPKDLIKIDDAFCIKECLLRKRVKKRFEK